MRWLLMSLLLSMATAPAQTSPATVPDAHLSDSASSELPDAPNPAQASHQIVFGEVDCAVGQIRWQITQDVLYTALLICLSRRSIDFNDPRVLQ